MLHYKSRYKTEAAVRALPIRLAGVIKESIVDGPELRYVVFTQGCHHHCPGCQNPDTHDPSGGFLTDTAKLWEDIVKNPMLRGVTFSGGEPFLWGEELAEVGAAARERGLTVMVYSGFTYEQLCEKAESEDGVRRLLTVSNYLVDGPFILERRNVGLLFRGSENQRILDVTCYPNSTAARVIEKF
ncbi:MAG: 4Fe-4S cluster-binding domain-containing protein [Eubacteriales bacterium]